jgi:hypothetical protein
MPSASAWSISSSSCASGVPSLERGHAVTTLERLH